MSLSNMNQGAPGKGYFTKILGSANTSLTGTPLFSQLSQAATSSAVGAFSLRAVNGSSVKAVQVRNGTTSATQDFYADRLGNLLTAPVTGQPLVNWLGGATGYVATWYDQSSAGNHATQATAANQPIIQRATKGPGYMVNFNGTSQFVTLSADSQFLNGTNITVNAVALRTATKATQNWFFGTNTPSVNYQRFQFGFGNDTSISMSITSSPPDITIPAYNASNEPVYYMTGGLIPTRVLYQNDTLGGTSVNSGLLSVPTAYSYSIGKGNQGGVYYYKGNLFELLILTSALDQTQVTQVYNNQFSMYGGTVLNVTSGTSTVTLSPGTYTFILAGGQGGGSSGRGGLGMILSAVLTLTATTSIKYVVGAVGGTSSADGEGGGGGATYIYDVTNSIPLFVAGGGGGSNRTVSGGSGGNAGTTTLPGTGAGGIAGGGAFPGGGAGGGLFGNGQAGLTGGGASFLVSASPVGSGTSSGGGGYFGGDGGFGGGGGAGGSAYAGAGGGGYTGGNSNGSFSNGSGGTSYAIPGSSGLTESATNTSSGYITVSK